VIAWITTLAAAATLIAAWLMPGSMECTALSWTSVILFVASLAQPTGRIRRAFTAGCITYLGGFYWLYSTISDFGGFPWFAATPIFLLFVAGSSIQFLIWAFAWEHLPPFFARWGLRTAAAWLIAYHFWIKIFPWDFGHTQLAFTALAQIAELGGVTLITFLMMWLAEVFTLRSASLLRAKILASAIFAAALVFGATRLQSVPSLYQAPLSTVMVQGNISLERKHDTSYFSVNRALYAKTSAAVAQRDTLIIWPESTITDLLPDNISDAHTSGVLPFLNNGSSFLVGGLTYRSREEFFNSSILVRPDGSVAPPYHKMILMPFGEYTPLVGLLPFLKEINATAAQFTAGTEPAVLEYSLSNGTPVRVSPLICYEDVVPHISRWASAKGANLLVNQTNDAWFGDTVAPYQHHTIASFRAIENRRFLLRSTNTGLTAAVDPLGRTLASLLPFSEGALPIEVNLIDAQTIFMRFPIPVAWAVVAALSLLALIKSALGSSYRKHPKRA
jgi:apolipoprotein N-acyltransferase